MVTYKLSSQFAPRARGLPFLKQNRRAPGSTAAASVRLSLSGRAKLDETGKLSLSGPTDADKTGEEMLPRCRNGDDCHQRRPKLRLTGRDGPPGLYNQKVTGGSACPVSPAVVWFASQQPATAGTRNQTNDRFSTTLKSVGQEFYCRVESSSGHRMGVRKNSEWVPRSIGGVYPVHYPVPKGGYVWC